MKTKELIKAVDDAFQALSDNCEHKDGGDCGHEDIDFNCLCCHLTNCPLIGRLDDGDIKWPDLGK